MKSRSKVSFGLSAGLLSAGLICFAAWLPSAVAADKLFDEFQNPPHSARPHTWWHWLNGNITKEGIAKDLLWMDAIGLGGVQNFNASLQTPQIVENPLGFMTPGWKDAFSFAVARADELGLDVAIASSPGWSETGGPWVRPEDGMKKLVWSQVTLEGGQTFDGKLPSPPAVTGPYQNIPVHDPLNPGAENTGSTPAFYADEVVLAYPVPGVELPTPVVSTGDGSGLDATALADENFDSVSHLPAGASGQPPALVLTYPEPVAVQSATLYVPHARPPFGEPDYLPVLEVMEGAQWRQVTTVPLAEVPTTVSFPEIRSRKFRLVFAPNAEVGDPLGEPAPGAVRLEIFGKKESDAIAIGHWTLSAEPRVHRAEAKAGFAVSSDYYALDTPAAIASAVGPGAVVNLTGRLQPNGRLQWTAPDGNRWRILRLGYSLTGKTNHPAAADATGLEVDKYDGDAVREYIEAYLSMYRDAVGEELMGENGLRAILTDSIEVGASNWTPNMIEKFEALRGYNPTPWLPVLTGTLIGTASESDAFLYDFRRTLGDLLVREHYKTIAAVARQQGLMVYGEALEDGRPVLGDDMAMRSHAAVPMAALWNFHRGQPPRTTLLGDMKGAASVAHIYGQNLVAAESMTSAFAPWAFAPSDLKRLIDLEFAYGVNRPVVHTSVHHPADEKVPGLSLMIFGQYFNRHETWASMAKPWIDYIARSSLMLQQGRYFADVAYFYGEEAPITALFKGGAVGDLPVRYAYDFLNADVLENQLSVEQGELVANSGARYKVLYLGGTSGRMTLPTLQRIAELVNDGATVIGMPPHQSPALQDDPDAFNELTRQLWAGENLTEYGRGRVFRSLDIEAVLAALGVSPDFEGTAKLQTPEVLFLHRRLRDGDLYFIANRENREVNMDARFRVTGKVPEIWRAIDGTISPVSYRFKDDLTLVPLTLGPEDAFFVVFRQPTTTPSKTIAQPGMRRVATLDNPWSIEFQPDRGAPESITADKLVPLNDSEVAAIRYFSGIATYRTEFTAPDDASGTLSLDLGEIGDVAEVIVNGQSAGITWFPPYRLEIGKYLRSGQNTLEVRVANLWVNRLIGDRQPGARGITFTAAPTYRPDAPLRQSGLIGPVTLLQVEAE